MREKGGIWFYALGIEWIMKSGLHIEVVSDASKKQKLFQNLESSFLRQIFFFSLDYMHRWNTVWPNISTIWFHVNFSRVIMSGDRDRSKIIEIKTVILYNMIQVNTFLNAAHCLCILSLLNNSKKVMTPSS